ncbi:MAG: hypothetical protein FD123_1176 [Bacteroidetes bacterium]|nr:MAG: hypothetical protein FD123_1176 [Bacteroidota bacterium]
MLAGDLTGESNFIMFVILNNSIQEEIMKKQLLLVAALAFGFVAQAQVLQFVYNGQGLASGSTLTATHTDPGTFYDIHTYIIHNLSSSANIKVRKTHLYEPGGITTQFCTNQLCYLSSVYVTPNATTVPQGDTLDLKAQYKPESATPGTSAIRYSAWDMSNPSDSIYFVIVYNGVTGIQPVTPVNLTLSAPAPNPASSVASMQFEVGHKIASSQLVIFNMLGEKVKEITMTEEKGTLRIDVSTMQQGIYFCSLTVDGKAVATRKLVVTR